MSSFSTLNTALSGLLSQRRALDVIGHNIANASTPGFSRRRAELSAVGLSSVPSMYTRSMNTSGGVKVSGITRIRDEFLEKQAIREHGAASRLGTESAMLGRIEAIFPEPSDVGLSAQFGHFYAAWDDVANSPGSIPARIALLQQANSLTSSLNDASGDLARVRRSAIDEAGVLIKQVNALASQIADLNGTIARATTAGLEAHDAADNRDELIMQLADIIGISAQPGANGTMNVTLGGSSLVREDRFESLQIAEAGPLAPPLNTLPFNKVEIQWSADGYPARVDSGQISGLLSTANHHVPTAVVELDKVAATMVSQVNAAHLSGKGLDPVSDVNLNFFDPASLTAGTIRISSDVAGQPSRVAAAVVDPLSPTSGALDASIAQQIAAMHHASNGPVSLYGEMIGRLAIDTQGAIRSAGIRAEVASRADDARLSVSGVSMDEELTALMTSQRSYEAASRLLTTIDQTLDTLINRTGLVGR